MFIFKSMATLALLILLSLALKASPFQEKDQIQIKKGQEKISLKISLGQNK